MNSDEICGRGQNVVNCEAQSWRSNIESKNGLICELVFCLFQWRWKQSALVRSLLEIPLDHIPKVSALV